MSLFPDRYTQTSDLSLVDLPKLESLITSSTCDALLPAVELEAQINNNRNRMRALGYDMNHAEQALLAVVIDIVFVCHRDHFRRSRPGHPVLHYSIHLLEVATRVKEHFNDNAELFYSLAGDVISARTIATCAALLHDSQEDIKETFKILTNKVVAFAVVEEFTRSKLKELLNPQSLNRLIELVSTLTISGDLDISDSFYIRKILADSIATQIKQADIDHNMITMPEVAPLGAAIRCAAQYGDIILGTRYEQDFYRNICLSVVACRKDLNKIDLGREPNNSAERMIAKFLAVEGEVAGIRLVQFYSKLLQRIENNQEPSILPDNINIEQLTAGINKIIEIFSVLGSHEGRIYI